MTKARRRRIAAFVERHRDTYEQIGRVTVIDEAADTERVVDWTELLEA